MSIASELISLTADVCRQHSLPQVSWLHLPPENPRDPHHKKFGVLVLADGSCGFFFTRLGDSLKQLRDKIDEKQILGTPVLELAEGVSAPPQPITLSVKIKKRVLYKKSKVKL